MSLRRLLTPILLMIASQAFAPGITSIGGLKDSLSNAEDATGAAGDGDDEWIAGAPTVTDIYLDPGSDDYDDAWVMKADQPPTPLFPGADTTIVTGGEPGSDRGGEGDIAIVIGPNGVFGTGVPGLGVGPGFRITDVPDSFIEGRSGIGGGSHGAGSESQRAGGGDSGTGAGNPHPGGGSRIAAATNPGGGANRVRSSARAATGSPSTKPGPRGPQADGSSGGVDADQHEDPFTGPGPLGYGPGGKPDESDAPIPPDASARIGPIDPGLSHPGRATPFASAAVEPDQSVAVGLPAPLALMLPVLLILIRRRMRL